MAYINNDKDKNLDDNGNPILTTTAPSSVGGVGTSASPTPAVGGSVAPTQPMRGKTNSGFFTDLQKYIRGNEASATNLAGNVAGNLAGTQQEANKAITQAATGFTQAVQSGTPQYNQEIVNQVVSNPNAALANKDLMMKFNEMRSGEYKGPREFQSSEFYNPAKEAVSKSQEKLNLAGTAGGRKELIRGTEGYHQGGGALSLDQLLVQNVKPAWQKIQEQITAGEPIAKNFETQGTELGKLAVPAMNQALEAQQKVGGALTTAQENIRKEIEAAVKAKREEAARNAINAQDTLLGALQQRATGQGGKAGSLSGGKVPTPAVKPVESVQAPAAPNQIAPVGSVINTPGGGLANLNGQPIDAHGNIIPGAAVVSTPTKPVAPKILYYDGMGRPIGTDGKPIVTTTAVSTPVPGSTGYGGPSIAKPPTATVPTGVSGGSPGTPGSTGYGKPYTGPSPDQKVPTPTVTIMPVAPVVEEKPINAPVLKDLTPAQLANLGITQEQWHNIMALDTKAREYGGGIDLQNYLTTQTPENVYTADTVASAEQRARWNALNQLQGISDPFLSNTNPDILGTKPVEFNIANAAKDLNAQIQAGLTRDKTEAVQQEVVSNTEKAAKPEKPSNLENTLSGAAKGAAIGSVVPGVGTAIGAVVGGVVGFIACFASGTPILMADGSVKNVEDITLLDDLAAGGIVTAVGQSLSNNIYQYHNTVMDGSHIIYHEGKWMKVSECNEAEKLALEDDRHIIVYPVVCQNHIMVTSDFVSADFAVLDDPWEMNEGERIEYLNNWVERNKNLDKVLEQVFPK